MMVFALISAFAPASIKLDWKPSLKPTLNYTCERTGLYGAWSPDMKMTLTRQVLDASKPDEIRIKETLVVLDDGQPRGKPVKFDPSHAQTETWQVIRAANGEWLSYDSPKDPHWPDASLVSDPLIDIIYPKEPVQKGQKWTYHSVDATSDRTSEFTYDGIEKIGRLMCNRVSVSLHALMSNGEYGGKVAGTGTFWLDPDDGTIVKSDLEFNEHGNGPVRLHEVIIRKA